MTNEFKPSRIQTLRDRFNMLYSTGQLRVDLPVILAGIHSSKPLEDRIEGLESLMAWIRLPLRTASNASALDEADEKPEIDQIRSRSVRFRFLIQLLNRNPHWKTELGAVIATVMKEPSGVRLFSATGLSKESGFFSELSNRLIKMLIPRAESQSDLADLFSRVFTETEDADWLEFESALIFENVGALLGPESDFPTLRIAMRDALVVLGAQTAALGVSEEVRSRLCSTDISTSPFIELNRVLSHPGKHVDQILIQESIRHCQTCVDEVFRRTEDSGVSVSLVYKLEKIGSSLGRIRLLTDLLNARTPSQINLVLPHLVASLIREEVSSRSVRGLVRANVHLLARKIVERTGYKGEHYIARSRAEIWEMFRSAIGGGVLTTFTAVMKVLIGHANFALFFQGFFSWLNYAGSFVLMQGLGFTLATKQPSMTASSLAGTLEPLSRTRSSEAVMTEISAIVRTQAVAAIGNIGAVVATAILVDFAWLAAFGHSVMDAEYAGHFVESLNPITSLTLPFAALTGVYLWLASICAGWFENWVVFRNIPEALGRSRRLTRIFGPTRMERWSKACAPTASGLAGNISLGFFLAFTPIFGRFFGLPFDVRHVTLSSGALAMAICSIGPSQVHWVDALAAVLGIFCIGFLNFGVSFILALQVAARSRDIPNRWLNRILRNVLLRFIRSPLKALSTPAKLPAENTEGT